MTIQNSPKGIIHFSVCWLSLFLFTPCTFDFQTSLQKINRMSGKFQPTHVKKRIFYPLIIDFISYSMTFISDVHSETSTDLESEISNQFWESGMENSVNQIEHSFPWSSGISEKAVGELLFPVIINGLILYPRDGHIPNDQSFYSSRNNGRPKFTLKSPPPLKIPRKNSDKIFLKSKWFQKGHDVWQQPKSSRCYSIHSSFQKDLSYFDNFNEKASGDETRIKLFSGSQIESEAPSIIEGQNGFQKEPSSFWNNSGSIYDGNIHQMRFGQPISSSFTSYYSTELSYRGTERQQMTYPPILQSTNQTQKKRKFAPTEHHWGSKGFSKFSLH